MSPWFRRRRAEDALGAETAVEPVEEPGSGRQPEEPAEPEPALDPTAPLSAERLDRALERLREEIPAPSEEKPPGSSG
jgi:hypothetical protein